MRNSGETQQLDHTKDLSQSSQVNDREGKRAWQAPLPKTPSDDKKNSCTSSRLYTNDAPSLISFPPITTRH